MDWGEGAEDIHLRTRKGVVKITRGEPKVLANVFKYDGARIAAAPTFGRTRAATPGWRYNRQLSLSC